MSRRSFRSGKRIFPVLVAVWTLVAGAARKEPADEALERRLLTFVAGSYDSVRGGFVTRDDAVRVRAAMVRDVLDGLPHAAYHAHIQDVVVVFSGPVLLGRQFER